MKRITFLWLWLFAMGCGLHGATYHSVKVSELDFGVEAAAVKEAFDVMPSWMRGGVGQVSFRCPRECYSALPVPEGGNRWGGKQGNFELVFRLEDDSPVEGFVDLRADSEGGFGQELRGFPFTFTPGKETVSTEERFNEIRSLHYRDLAEGHLPGTTWFKHRAGLDEEILNNAN